MTGVGLSQYLQLEVVRFQLCGAILAAVSALLFLQQPKALETTPAVHDHRGSRLELTQHLQGTDTLSLEVLPYARVDVHMQGDHAPHVLLLGLDAHGPEHGVHSEVNVLPPLALLDPLAGLAGLVTAEGDCRDLTIRYDGRELPQPLGCPALQELNGL